MSLGQILIDGKEDEPRGEALNHITTWCLVRGNLSVAGTINRFSRDAVDVGIKIYWPSFTFRLHRGVHPSVRQSLPPSRLTEIPREDNQVLTTTTATPAPPPCPSLAAATSAACCPEADRIVRIHLNLSVVHLSLCKIGPLPPPPPPKPLS